MLLASKMGGELFRKSSPPILLNKHQFILLIGVEDGSPRSYF